uniref:Rap guanine nucleotide exchange factor 3 n=1 Tax=Salmo trutta TaxID=8032 RepID=A0A673WL49_SALTR
MIVRKWKESESCQKGKVVTIFLSDRILKAARVVYSALIERNPDLIRDRKHHLKTYRQCCSGKDLVDWLMKLNKCLQSRSQAVGMWQVLVDEGIIVHVKQELNFHDKDTQFYRFLDSEFGLNHLTNEKDALNHTGLSLLLQMGPDALLTMILRKCPSQRSAEDLEVIYEELLHVKAAAHLSTSVRKELAAVLVFESHAKAGTVLFSQGDKGTSWYIIWKGSVNVITHGKGLVTTLHEGEDFGQLALVNDAPRADFIRILKDVEANTVRLEEHGKAVLVLEKAESTNQGGTGNISKYTVMSGTPEKILEHLLETVKLDTNGNDAIDPCVSDFLLTHRVFMPSSQLCPCTYHAEPSEGSELEKAAYTLNTKQKIVKLIGQWVALFSQMLKDDPIAVDFLEVSEGGSGLLYEHTQILCALTDWSVLIIVSILCFNAKMSSPMSLCFLVLYEIFRPDHTSVTLMLPVNSSVQEVMSSLINPGGDHVLVKMNSMGGGWLFMSSGSNLNPFSKIQLYRICNKGAAWSIQHLYWPCSIYGDTASTPLKKQQGPDQSTMDTCEQMCPKDIASQLTNYDWELFTAMHEVELVYYIFGRHKFPGATTANLERFVRRFNEVQYWVVTEVCLCTDLVKRAMLLKKFIKIAVVLKEQKNLNSFFAVMFGLSNSAVQRLYKTWERVPSKTKRVYCAYERLMDPSRNHRAYRLAVAKLSPPYIPFMPLLLKGNNAFLASLNVALPFFFFLHISSSVSCPDSEQSLPLRNASNIRHYVQNFEVIDNQHKLTQLSRAMER